MIENINWYPGHMKKTRELIQQNLKMVDGVIEVIDARIPVSSRNPIIDEIVGDKPRIIGLNKSDLADSAVTEEWVRAFAAKDRAMVLNSVSGGGIRELFKTLEAMEKERNRQTVERRDREGVGGTAALKPFRLMIVGVPNVGKSSLINRLTGKKSAKTGDRPGVTKGKQWLRLSNGMQLLDTPGILWPKFEDPKTGLNLAFCGSIKDEIMDVPSLALELIKYLASAYPQLLAERYKLDEIAEDGLENMENIAVKRGCILPGKRIDYERTGRMVLDEFRAGLIGRISLEKPSDEDSNGDGE